MGIRKTTKEGVLPSSLIAINNPSFVKSLLEGWTMLFRPPNLSTTSFPILLFFKQSGMC
jgi:hypothetical protein